MWYSGNDGTTWRILEAIQPGGGTWERVGVALDAGFAGDSDNYGVESPCVVKTPGGYLMVYAGFDGDVARLHMAMSIDGRQWIPEGTIMQRGREDAAGASDPCVVMTGERWWLFFSGYDGSQDNRRAAILAAISQSGASWDRVGTVLTPDEGELAVSHPCVLDISGTFRMFYASDDGRRVEIALATVGRRSLVGPARHGSSPVRGGARWAHRPRALRSPAPRWLVSDVVLRSRGRRRQPRLPDLLSEIP